MLQAINPVSFQAKANFEMVSKFKDSAGKPLGLQIKAVSDGVKTYKLDTYIFDSKGYVKGGYSSGLGEGAVKTLPEFAQEVYSELKKIGSLFNRYNIKGSDDMMEGLVDFFAKAAE